MPNELFWKLSIWHNDSIVETQNDFFEDSTGLRLYGKSARGISPGGYRIHYASAFNHVYDTLINVQRSINIRAPKHLDIFANTERIEPFITNNFEAGDTLCIASAHSGCFHFYQEHISFYHRGDSIYVSMVKYDNGITKSFALTKAYSLKLLRAFEHQSQNIKLGGCTSNVSYYIFLKGKYVLFDDNTCEWDGYFKLLEALKLK